MGKREKTGRRGKGGLEGDRDRRRGNGEMVEKGREWGGRAAGRETERPGSTGRDSDRDKLRDRGRVTILERPRETRKRQTRSMYVCAHTHTWAHKGFSMPAEQPPAPHWPQPPPGKGNPSPSISSREVFPSPSCQPTKKLQGLQTQSLWRQVTGLPSITLDTKGYS